MKPLLLLIAFALWFYVQPADAIVSEHVPAHALYDYQQSLLVAFFTIVCSALLITLVLHYYRIQWGRRSLLTR